MIPSSLRLKQPTQKPVESIPIMEQENEPKQNLPSSLRPKSLKPKQKEAEFPFERENDLEREIERNIAQQTSRIGETILGLPGDLYSFAKNIFGFEPETNVPTSESLRKFSEEASLGYTKPKSESEERAGEVMQDIASFMIPGSKEYSMLRNIGIPVVANLAQEGVKYAGGEKIAGAVKSGLMIALDLLKLRSGGAKKYAGSLFGESEKLVPEGAKLRSPKLEKSLMGLEKSLESGGSAPSTTKALTKVSEIQSKIKNGEIEVKELIDFRKNINEIIQELGGFEVQLPKHIKKKAIANLGNVKSKVIDALDEYGQVNKEFGKINKSANEAYAAYAQSNKIADFIKKTTKSSIKNPGLKAILGLAGGTYGAVAHGAALGKTAALAGPPLFAGYETYKILHQVIKSPTLRKYYGNILKGAASGNASQVIKNSKALDKALEED